MESDIILFVFDISNLANTIEMGITYLFGDWIVNLPYPNVRTQRLPSNVEGLCIDINGMIHKAAQHAYAYGEGDYAENVKRAAGQTDAVLQVEFQNEFGRRLEEAITTAKPRQYVMFCVDGVAKGAKVNQQRNRRFMAAVPKDSKEIKLGSIAPTNFSSAVITPGTVFMENLDVYIVNWIAKNRNLLPPTVIYSSHLEPGEGEHKIFRFLMMGLVQKGRGKHLVYGLDADLIMLSMKSDYDIMLVREDFGDLLDIAALKAGVVSELSEAYVNADSRPSDDIIVQDCIVMIFFVGNDFLPHMMAFERVGHAIRTMFAIYKRMDQPITTAEGAIDWKVMTTFVALLAEEEPELLKLKASYKFEYKSSMLDTASKKLDLPKQEEKKGRGMYGRRDRDDRYYEVTDFDYDMFRSLWYVNALTPRTVTGKYASSELDIKSITPESIEAMCRNYAEMLQWIILYYTGQNVSNYLLYHYNHCPLLSDLAFYLDTAWKNETAPSIPEVLATEGEEPFHPIHVLVAVVPPSLSHIIPEPYDKLVKNGGELHDMAPVNFIIEREGKDKEWQGVAILPSLDMARVVDTVDKLGLDFPSKLDSSTTWVNQRGDLLVLPERRPGRGRGGRGRGAPRGTFRGGARGGRGRGGQRGGRGRGSSNIIPRRGGGIPRGRGGSVSTPQRVETVTPPTIVPVKPTRVPPPSTPSRIPPPSTPSRVIPPPTSVPKAGGRGLPPRSGGWTGQMLM